MPSKTQPIYPAETKLLADLGERLRLARLRRNLTADALAERSSISRMTLHRAETGSPGVAMGTYVRILSALRLEADLELIAKDDMLGRKLQDLALPKRKNLR